MDIDGFKAPRLPGQPSSSSSSNSNNKRKATEDLNGHSSKGKQRAAVEEVPTVSVSTEDDNDEEKDIDEEASYNSFAPGNDADYFMEDDSEGRFYGGGLNSTQKQILDIFDGDEENNSKREEDGGGDLLTVQKVRRQLLNLERAINKNAEMRVKWSGQPEKFVESEVALDTAIQELLLLTQNPREFYPELIKLGIPNSLADLLSHENIDISLAVINALGELTDDDVTEGNLPSDDEDDDQASSSSARALRATTGSLSSRAAVVSLADSLLSAQLVELAVNNLSRLNEENEEAERGGVYQTLSLIENLLSLQPNLSSSIAKNTSMIAWLLKRLQPATASGKSSSNGKEKGKAVEEDPVMAQNRRYSAELLAIVLQGTEVGKEARIRFGKDHGIEVCLKVLSAYRKRDPSGADEIEYMENIFDSLCSSISSVPENKATFMSEEGVELMVIMMKEKMLARNRAIKVLDHALTGDAGTEGCERFVEVLGLKSLFSAFMNKDTRDSKKKTSQQHNLTNEDQEHILSILVALLTNLSSDSIPRIRLLAKFVEDNYSKIDRLITIRTSLLSRVRQKERELAIEKASQGEEGLELDEVEEYLIRLEGGLASLQMADTVLAWCCMEDDGVRDHARKALQERKSDFREVVGVLQEYQKNIGDAQVQSEDDTSTQQEAEEADRQRGILEHLIMYLQGC